MNLTDAIHKIEQKFMFTSDLAQKIAQKVSDEFRSRIEGGQVTPDLNPVYKAWKVKNGYPEYPLIKTGELAGSLKLGECTGLKMTIVSSARVNIFWHAGDKRAKGVPKRDPMTSEDISRIAAEVYKEYLNG